MGFSQLTLLAHSGGAFIAAQYALQFPERVDRLILVAPGSPVRDPFAAQTVAAFEARLNSATWDRMNTLRASMPTAELYTPCTAGRVVLASLYGDSLRFPVLLMGDLS